MLRTDVAVGGSGMRWVGVSIGIWEQSCTDGNAFPDWFRVPKKGEGFQCSWYV